MLIIYPKSFVTSTQLIFSSTRDYEMTRTFHDFQWFVLGLVINDLIRNG